MGTVEEKGKKGLAETTDQSTTFLPAIYPLVVVVLLQLSILSSVSQATAAEADLGGWGGNWKKIAARHATAGGSCWSGCVCPGVWVGGEVDGEKENTAFYDLSLDDFRRCRCHHFIVFLLFSSRLLHFFREQQPEFGGG